MPAKLERCVRAVKRQGGAVNPYAVCNAAIQKKERRMARKKKHHTATYCKRCNAIHHHAHKHCPNCGRKLIRTHHG